MNWKRQAITLYSLFALFLILVTVYYERVSLVLYMGIILTSAIYPMIWIFISFKLRELIILLKTNKDLIHTIQTILQVFPEGVIIRSLDETTKQTILKFANRIANKVLIGEWNQEQDCLKNKRDWWSTNKSRNWERKLCNFRSFFLNKQEVIIDRWMSENIEQMIKIKGSIVNLQNEFVRNSDIEKDQEEAYFSVKSIKVNWDNNEESYLHVFINTTQVKKLEKRKS